MVSSCDLCPFRSSFCFVFISVRLLSVLRGHSFFSSSPQRTMTSDLEGFLYQILSIKLFSYLNSWERASIVPFECSVLNKGTTGTIFITSLVWRGPWLGIEPGTSHTRSQHSTTRLLVVTELHVLLNRCIILVNVWVLEWLKSCLILFN